MNSEKKFQKLPLLWELCLKFLYNGNYIKGFDEFLKNKKVSNILDCACGTGFPSIKLSKFGYDITCSDENKEMLKRFNKNALDQKVNLYTIHSKWQNLDKHFRDEFDCVLCRGNSLVYVISWGKDKLNPIKAKMEIENSLRNFYNVLKNGGFCYIDVPPRTEFEQPNNIFFERFSKRRILGKEVNLLWMIKHEPDIKIRTWIPEILVWNSASVIYREKYTYKSYLINHFEFIKMLKKVGFSKIDAYQKIEGENTYDIFIAYK